MIPGDVGYTNGSYAIFDSREEAPTPRHVFLRLQGSFMVLAMIESAGEDQRVDETRYDVFILCRNGSGWIRQWTIDELDELGLSA